MNLAVSDLENLLLKDGLPPRRTIIRSRAALIPATNRAGDELTNLVSAGAASWVNR